jgi:hypothetical protein
MSITYLCGWWPFSIDSAGRCFTYVKKWYIRENDNIGKMEISGTSGYLIKLNCTTITNWTLIVSVTLRLAVYRQSVRLHAEPLETYDQYFFKLNICCYSPYVTSPLIRGWVCRLQLLLALARAFILGSESCGTRDHIYSLRFETSLVVASSTVGRVI